MLISRLWLKAQKVFVRQLYHTYFRMNERQNGETYSLTVFFVFSPLYTTEIYYIRRDLCEST